MKLIYEKWRMTLVSNQYNRETKVFQYHEFLVLSIPWSRRFTSGPGYNLMLLVGHEISRTLPLQSVRSPVIGQGTANMNDLSSVRHYINIVYLTE